MNRARENRLIVIVGGLALALIGLVLAFRSGAVAPVGPLAVPTPTPVISDQAKVEAVGLLTAAVQQRTDGQIGPALDLGDQALAKWPQYDAAQRFMLTAVPQGTAVAQNAQARASAAAQSAVTAAQADATARRVYVSKAGLFLQRYADALGGFNQKNREARDQPALVVDSAWRLMTSASLATMQETANTLTTLGPVPSDMATAVGLFNQIAVETTQFSQDYGRGIGDAGRDGLGGVPFPGDRTDHVRDLLRQANFEIRRTSPGVP